MAVIGLEIKSRAALAGGREFGGAGSYTQLDGTAHFAVDPAHPLNRGITREARAATGDPRRSIEERYAGKAAYLEQIRREALNLIDAGYLLAEDLELVVDQASRRYELLASVREPVAAGG